MEFSALLKEDLFRRRTNRFSHLVQEVTFKLMSLENKLNLPGKLSVVALCSCQRLNVARAVKPKQSKVVKLQPMMISSIQSRRMSESVLNRQIILCLLSYLPKITLQWPSVQMHHVLLKNRLMNLRPSLVLGTMNKRVVSLKREVARSNEAFMEMQQPDLQWVDQVLELYHMQTQPLCKVALRVSTSYLKQGDLDLQKRNKLQDRLQVQAIIHKRIYRSGSSAAIT